MTRHIRRLGPSIEAVAYAAANRAFERHWWAIFNENHLDLRLAKIVEVWERSIDSIVRNALRRHGVVRIPCRGARPRARVRHSRPRCAVRVAGRRATTGDPDEEYPRQVWPTKGGAR